MSTTYAYAATDSRSPLARSNSSVARCALDVQIDVLYCGVCHSDLQARNEWRNTIYPVVPGHEIVGRVTATGGRDALQGRRAGRRRLPRRFVPHLRELRRRPRAILRERLRRHLQQDRVTGDITFGGYSTQLVVDEAFVLRVPETLDPAGAAPLLCAGITTYSPLRRWNVGPGKKVGIVAGGLGHMGVKLARAQWGARRAVHHVAVEDRGRQAGRRARSRDLEGRGADERAPEQLRLHPEHGRRAARPEPVPAPAQARRHDDAGRRASTTIRRRRCSI